MFRGGSFFGPLLGAWVVHIGGPGAVYWVAVVVCGSAAVLLLLTKKDAILNTPVVVAGRTLEVAKREWKKLATVGVGVSVIGILRTSRPPTLGDQHWDSRCRGSFLHRHSECLGLRPVLRIRGNHGSIR